jgi:5'-3' exonuclease
VNRRPPRNGENLKKSNILLVDGNALFKRGFLGSKDEYNSEGRHIGGLYQFITVLRKVMLEDLYHKVFVFWDGPYSGKLRYEVYKDYKIGRGKDYENGTIPIDLEELSQKRRIKQYLEELFIRQLEDEIVESDDFIAYICNNKKPNETITIITSDRDLCQLINDDVKIYMCDLKTYVTKDNFNLHFKYKLENAALIKTLCGDNSDSIKGVKRLGQDTLLKHFPEIKKEVLTVEQVINKSKLLQNERIESKTKPLQVFDYIVNGTTDGIQGENLYKINNYLVNLKNPLLTEEALRNVNDLIDLPINPEGRSVKNVYEFARVDGMNDKIKNYNEEYFLPFKKLIEREKITNVKI